MSDTPKTPSGHTLYRDGDADAPECIKDGNGQVALGLCRVCGKGEVQLSEPCTPKTRTYQVNFEKHTVEGPSLTQGAEALAAGGAVTSRPAQGAGASTQPWSKQQISEAFYDFNCHGPERACSGSTWSDYKDTEKRELAFEAGAKWALQFLSTSPASPAPEDALVAGKLARIRELTAKMQSLPEASVWAAATVLDRTVCDYLTATCAENMREVLAYIDRLQGRLAVESANLEQTRVQLAGRGVAQTHLDHLREALDQTRVQLAGCGVAALGYARPGSPGECKPGAYGHSGSFAQVVDLYEAYARLREFKDLVHRRLDEMGIPTNPDGGHSKAGCRIGDRLDVVAKRLKALDLPVAASMTLSLERDGAEPLQVQARCAVEHTGRVEGLTRALAAVLDTLDREWPQHKTWREHSPEASSLREARALLQKGT